MKSVIARKNEVITIGDVSIQVHKIARGQVKILIQAPRTTQIVRAEAGGLALDQVHALNLADL